MKPHLLRLVLASLLVSCAVGCSTVDGWLTRDAGSGFETPTDAGLRITTNQPPAVEIRPGITRALESAGAINAAVPHPWQSQVNWLLGTVVAGLTWYSRNANKRREDERQRRKREQAASAANREAVLLSALAGKVPK